MRTLLEPSGWQMTPGERAAVEGVLSSLRPKVAVEVGSASGGSLERAMAHAEGVHSFDLILPDTPPADGLVLHTGDSHELLGPWLHEALRSGLRIDYVLVDGDHSRAGVFADLSALLASPALDGVVLAHDSANPAVRAGLVEAIEANERDVTMFNLDFVRGRVIGGNSHSKGKLCGGLALIVVDRSGRFADAVTGGTEYRDIHHIEAAAAALLRAPALLRHRVGNVARRVGLR